jgi:hypothetical protein
MKIPPQSTGVVVHYGEVYIESPSYPDDTRESWSVWDPRPVRQGARCIGDKLSFQAAEAMALRASADELHRPVGEEAMRGTPLADPCEVCGGTGRVTTGTAITSVAPLGSYPAKIRCPSCDGAGRSR